MASLKTGLASSAAILVVLLFGATAQAQPQSSASMRVWQGEQPWAQWNLPSAESRYVSAAPRNAAETARIEAAADAVLADYPQAARPFGLYSWNVAATFQPPQAGPDRNIAIMIRMRDDTEAFAGACGMQGLSEYMTVPAAWFDTPRSDTWINAYPELSLAMAIGWRQMGHHCAERLNIAARLPSEAQRSPTPLALNNLGSALGFWALLGQSTRDGDVWDAQTVGRILDRMGVQQFSDNSDFDTPTGLARRIGGLRRVDRPLFSLGPDAGTDAWVWYYAGMSRDWAFLSPLLASAPASDTDSALRSWFDAALRQSSDPALGLDRGLAVLNWNDLSAIWQSEPSLRGRGVFRRDVWQGAMVSANAAPGCVPVTLSQADAAIELNLDVAEAAANCLVVSWTGPRLDPDLPPTFSVVASARGVDADGLDALHLSADQNWESASDADRSVPIIRPGLVVEDARSRQAAKTWEVIFRPDDVFGDDRMTLVFTNLHPDGDDRTRPMDLDLTIGSGAHEARQALRGTMLSEDGDPCRDQQQLPLNIASTYAMPAPAFQTAALDAEDFSIEGHLMAVGARDLQREMSDCGRVQAALFTASVPGAPAGSPSAVCETRMAEMAGMGARAMAAAQGGSMGGLGDLQPRQITFSLTPRRPITGPGTYPADASVGYEDLGLEERGMSLPSSNHGEGSITVVAAGPGMLRIRYEARFEPQQCVAHLSGTISGEVESVVALPLVGMSRREIIAPRAVELIGDRRWMALPVATRREMEREPRRGESEPAQAPSGPASPGSTLPGLPQCDLSPAEVRNILDEFARQLPAEVRADLLAQISADPDAARMMACTIREMG